MRFCTGKTCIALVAALGGCAAPPLVDMNDVNPVVYQRDLDRCDVEAQSVEPAGPVIAGLIMGATMGLGLGAFAGGATTYTTTMAEGYGAAAGGVTGAGISAATNAPLAVPPPAPRQTVADCLTASGYRIIKPAP
jgi:hypothetical protein